jgi:hypothetical protein
MDMEQAARPRPDVEGGDVPGRDAFSVANLYEEALSITVKTQ